MSAPAPAPTPARPGGVALDPSTWVRVMAPLLFALAWLGMAFRWPLLPVGRTLSTMVCAVMAVALGVISPEDAFASVSLATLALLFGSMVMAALLEREGFFTHVQRLWCMGLPAGSGGGGGGTDAHAAPESAGHSEPASNRSGLRARFHSWMAGQGEYAAHHLLVRVVFSSGLLSALFTNDSWCVVGTPVLLRLCARFRLPYAPFLLALATSANIGSAASPVGNPQNMLIAASSGIGFSQFLRYLFLPSFLALAINAALLCAVYHSSLKGHRITWTEAVLARAEADELDEEEEQAEQGGEGKPRRPSLSALVESAKTAPSAEDLRAQRRHAHQYDQVAEEDENAAANNDPRTQPLRRGRGSGPSAGQHAMSPGGDGEAEVLLRDAPFSSSSSSSSSLRPMQSVVWPVLDARSAAVAEAGTGAFAGEEGELDSETAFAALDPSAPLDSSRNNASLPAATRAPRAGCYPDLEPFLSATATPSTRQWALEEYVRRAALQHYYGVDYREEEERLAKAKLKASQGGSDSGHAAAAPAHPLRFRRGGRYASPALPSASASAAFNARARANNMPLSPPPPPTLEEAGEGDEENPAAAGAPAPPVAAAAAAAARASGVGGRAGRLEMQPPPYAALAVAHLAPAPPVGALATWLDRQGSLGSALARCGSTSKVRLFSLVLTGTLIAFLAGAPLAWAALAGAIGMLLLDGVDPDVSGLWHSAGVDWALLLFFSALFVVVDALRLSGWPEQAWAAAAPVLDVRTAGGAALYSLLILLGSNTVSNVPLVLILSPSLRALPDPVSRHAAWLLLAYVSTLAGNLTLVGSVANLIVVARARRWYELKFWEYARFGSWTTVLLIAGGVAIIMVELP